MLESPLCSLRWQPFSSEGLFFWFHSFLHVFGCPLEECFQPNFSSFFLANSSGQDGLILWPFLAPLQAFSTEVSISSAWRRVAFVRSWHWATADLKETEKNTRRHAAKSSSGFPWKLPSPELTLHPENGWFGRVVSFWGPAYFQGLSFCQNCCNYSMDVGWIMRMRMKRIFSWYNTATLKAPKIPKKESLVYYTVDLEILHQVVLWILSNISCFFWSAMAKWRNFFRSCHMVPCETLHVENGMEELKTFDEMIWSEGLRTTLPKTT